MSVGIKVLDEDHQHLIGIINHLEDVIENPDLRATEREDSLRILFGRLKAYTREHFAREEGMQATSHYKGLAENHDDHQKLIADLDELSNSYMAGNKAEKVVSKDDMLSFLRHWLVDHIIKIDLKMRGHRIRAQYW